MSEIKLYPYERRQIIRHSNKFHETNPFWNSGKFNQKQNIGPLMDLIRKSGANTQTAWEEYYFKSGIELLNEKKKIYKRISDTNTRNEYVYLANQEYGRTMEDLYNLTKSFKKYLDEKIPDNKYTEEELFNYIYIRVIDETYLGFAREREALRILQDFCKPYGFTAEYADAKIDSAYGVDIEIKQDGKLLCGVQVKSDKVKKGWKDIENGKNNLLTGDYALKEKHKEDYKKKFGVETFYMFLDSQYRNIDADIFLNINKLKNIAKETTVNKFNSRVYIAYDGLITSPIGKVNYSSPAEIFTEHPSALLPVINELINKYGNDGIFLLIPCKTEAEFNLKKALTLRYAPNINIENAVKVHPNEKEKVCQIGDILITPKKEDAKKWKKEFGNAIYATYDSAMEKAYKDEAQVLSSLYSLEQLINKVDYERNKEVMESLQEIKRIFIDK